MNIKDLYVYTSTIFLIFILAGVLLNNLPGLIVPSLGYITSLILLIYTEIKDHFKIKDSII